MKTHFRDSKGYVGCIKVIRAKNPTYTNKIDKITCKSCLRQLNYVAIKNQEYIKANQTIARYIAVGGKKNKSFYDSKRQIVYGGFLTARGI